MAGRSKKKSLPLANEWPEGLSDEELAEFVETHDLSRLMGKGVPANIEFTKEAQEATQQKKLERLAVSLKLTRADLEEIRRLAQEKDVPSTALMRSWIREGLRRERHRAG